jgi:hypothetical protein
MKKKSFEEKQLKRTMVRIEEVSAGISTELEVIFEELDRKGKWNEFMSNIDSIKPAKGAVDEVKPEKYYEALHFVFHIVEKFEDFRTSVEIAAIEDYLFTGRGIDAVELPLPAIELFDELGIHIEPGEANAQAISNDDYYERLSIFYLKSRRLLELMTKAHNILKESKLYIFQHYC